MPVDTDGACGAGLANVTGIPRAGRQGSAAEGAGLSEVGRCHARDVTELGIVGVGSAWPDGLEPSFFRSRQQRTRREPAQRTADITLAPTISGQTGRADSSNRQEAPLRWGG